MRDIPRKLLGGCSETDLELELRLTRVLRDLVGKERLLGRELPGCAVKLRSPGRTW